MRASRLVPILILVLAFAAAASPADAATKVYIVQAPTSQAARAGVLRVHGTL